MSFPKHWNCCTYAGRHMEDVLNFSCCHSPLYDPIPPPIYLTIFLHPGFTVETKRCRAAFLRFLSFLSCSKINPILTQKIDSQHHRTWAFVQLCPLAFCIVCVHLRIPMFWFRSDPEAHRNELMSVSGAKANGKFVIDLEYIELLEVLWTLHKCKTHGNNCSEQVCVWKEAECMLSTESICEHTKIPMKEKRRTVGKFSYIQNLLICTNYTLKLMGTFYCLITQTYIERA